MPHSFWGWAAATDHVTLNDPLSQFFLPSPPPSPPFLEFLAIYSTTRPPNSFKIKMRVIHVCWNMSCTLAPPSLRNSCLCCYYVYIWKMEELKAKNLVKLCVCVLFSLPDFQWCFALVFSHVRYIGAPHQDGSTGRHQSHGRYRGIMAFFLFLFFFFENDINQSQSYLLRFYGFNFWFSFFSRTRRRKSNWRSTSWKSFHTTATSPPISAPLLKRVHPAKTISSG
jgi:hypothetical protein